MSERHARSSDEKLTPFQLGLIEQFYAFPVVATRRFLAGRGSMREEFEECVASGYLGLVVAARRFNKRRLGDPKTTNGAGYIYSTVSGYIQHSWRDRNYWRMHDETLVPKPSVILATATSMDVPIYGSHSGVMYSIGETIPSPGNLEEEAVERLAIQSLASSIRNKLSQLDLTPDQLKIFQGLERGESHRTIAENIGRSQNFVSSNIRRITQVIVEDLGVNPPELS